ncbi:MAG: carboxypeptidase regulatory-like domain-containing protein [Bacteroidales bacterium]|nr:carboxypeptidase regulatory-like domain-containing protein [Bacteroidales bacterium]
MSQLIITTDVSQIRPVFNEGTAENIKRYNQLKKLFENTKEYRIFAEPVPAGGQKVAWHTEFEGKIIPFRKLDEEDQETAKGLLKTEANRLYKTIVAIIDEDANRKRIFDLIDSCIEIPDFDDIYLVQNADGRKNFCLVRWGFINEDFNAPKNLIANLVPLKVASVNIRAIKGNNKLAEKEKIYFEYDGKVKEFVTNEKGKIFLEDIKLLTKITAYQKDKDDKKQYEQEFLVENDTEITFYIGNQSLPKQYVSIQTMDDRDNILANVSLRVQYDDVEFESDTNSQGIIELGELFVGTKVTCHQLKNKNIVKTNHFEVQQGKSIYFVNVIEHKTKGNVKIRVIDENGELIPFAQIQVKFPDGELKYFESDEKGLFEIDDMPFKEDVVFRQIIDKLPQFQQIIKFTDENKTFDFKGKIVKTPFDYTKLTVKIVNSNDEPISNLKVVIENGIKSFNQITDNNGAVVWKEIDCSKKIVVSVENKGKKRKEEIKCEGQETNHTIKLGKKVGMWWLWLLLLIALIALGIIFGPKIIGAMGNNDNTDTTQNNIVVVDSNIVKDHAGMKFTVIDENNNKISNAKINITYADSTFEKTTNADGEVIFENLLDSNAFATAIITAPSFTEQRLTFKISHNKTITLRTSSIEISEQILPCGTQIESKGYHSTIQTFHMKKDKGTFKLFYNMFDIADKIIVYKGHASNISTDNIIWQSPNFENKSHTVYVNFESLDSLVTVEIQGGDTTRTEWYFKVNCP